MVMLRNPAPKTPVCDLRPCPNESGSRRSRDLTVGNQIGLADDRLDSDESHHGWWQSTLAADEIADPFYCLTAFGEHGEGLKYVDHVFPLLEGYGDGGGL